ncbi:hypothetical protein GN109_23265 [Collimonas pratensis]|uniref:hypothetical protein n=1 Tax=Collimonas pratensis TaxID=279113 RepID=UPI00143D23E3|nr:hypothetical protein [Collimonas pratensis]NKI72350.1 hypothetical protein [Collimonas pratensis]
MSLEIVQKFMELPVDRTNWDADAWKLVRDGSTFLSVDWGEETEEIITSLNDIVGVQHPITASYEVSSNPAGFTHILTYQGRTLQISYAAERHDCFIVVLTLAELVKENIDIRFCKYSIGNSDLCFLPLSPAEWLMLEASHGQETINHRFLKLPQSFNEFATYIL